MDRRLAAGLFGAGVVLMLPSLWLPAGVYDEAAIVVGGEALLRGGLPYRDFWTIYPPGTHYLAAGALALFGQTLTATRLTELLLRALVAMLVGRLAARVAGRSAGIIGWALAITLIWQFGPGLQPLTLVYALTFVATDRLLEALDGGDWRLGVLAGVLIGLAVTVRHDLAAYAAIGHLAGLAIAWRDRRIRHLLNPWPVRPVALAYFWALAITTSLVLGLAALTLPIHDMLDALIVVPATIYPLFRRLASPPAPALLTVPLWPWVLAWPIPREMERCFAPPLSVWRSRCWRWGFSGGRIAQMRSCSGHSASAPGISLGSARISGT